MAVKTDFKEFFVFIGDSNLWISGRRVQGAKLIDAGTDPRFRVDVGKLLNIVTRSSSSISRVFLYGSIPCRNDTIWDASRKMNFYVKTYCHPYFKGEEKDIDVAMASDIMETLFTQAGDNSTFVIVTGDSNLKLPLQILLKKGMSIDLWSWEQSMSHEYWRLTGVNPSVKIHALDDGELHFSYKSCIVSSKNRKIDPSHSLVIKNIPKGKHSLHIVADSVSRLMYNRFHISTCSFPDEATQDLILEFPTQIDADPLKEYEIGYEHCTYDTYSKSLAEGKSGIDTTHLFEVLSTEKESLSEAMASFVRSDPDEIYSVAGSESVVGSESYFADDEASVLSGGREEKNTMDCRWGVHCVNGSHCIFKHNEYEMEVFRRCPSIQYKYWKAKLCDSREWHRSEEQKKWCAFAHDDKDSWCLKCKIYGHLTHDCPH